MDESNSNFDEKKLDNDDFDDEVDDDASRIDGDSKYLTGVDKVSHYEKVADDAGKTYDGNLNDGILDCDGKFHGSAATLLERQFLPGKEMHATIKF